MKRRPRLILSADDLVELRRRVADPATVEAQAWAYHKRVRCDSYLDDAPKPTYRTGSGDYVELDADSRKARNLAIGYAVTGDPKYAVAAWRFLLAWTFIDPYAGGTDNQAAYHQSYGAFSFALAYDLIRDTLGTDERSTVDVWLRKWCVAFKTMQTAWSKDYWFSHVGRRPYPWNAALTQDYTEWYTGRDATQAPLCAWLACAIMAKYRVADVFAHRLNPPLAMRCALANDNDGDGRGVRPAPEVLVSATADYMSYNVRLSSILYQLCCAVYRATPDMQENLFAAWAYVSRWAPPESLTVPRPGDSATLSLLLSRLQIAERLFPGHFTEQVCSGSYPRAQFYESQFLGPTTLTQFAP